jgi:isoquinoline 1-oxidoreductase subunit beta
LKCARQLPKALSGIPDPDTTEGAIDLVYDFPNFHVEYVRVEPPGIPTAFWRSVGPSHNVFVTESFIDELAATAKQDPVAYRRALLGKSPRAKAILDLAAEKAGWGRPLPDRVGRGIALQFAFGSYMAHVAEIEASKDGRVRVRRVVCAVDCGIGASLCSMNFQYPKFGRGSVQRPIAFPRRPVRFVGHGSRHGPAHLAC